MSNKHSGLGRGLGDLLEDNTPQIRSEAATVIKKENGSSVSVTPTPEQAKIPSEEPTEAKNAEISENPSPPHSEQPLHRGGISLKASFKNFKN